MGFKNIFTKNKDMGAVRSLESAFNPQEFSQRRQSIDLHIVCLRQLAALNMHRLWMLLSIQHGFNTDLDRNTHI